MFVPAEELAKMLNMPVTWNGTAGELWLGYQPTNAVPIKPLKEVKISELEVLNHGGTQDIVYFGDVSEISGKMMFSAYGIEDIWGVTNENGWADYVLDGKYSKVDGDLFTLESNMGGLPSGAKLQIYGDEVLLLEKSVEEGADSVHFEVALDGVKNLKLSLTMTEGTADVGFGNVKLIKYE